MKEIIEYNKSLLEVADQRLKRLIETEHDINHPGPYFDMVNRQLDYVNTLKERIKLINPEIKTVIFKEKITNLNIKKIFKNFDIIVDGSDNFKTKFLLNEYSLKYKKILIVGAISKFDGHIFSFNFNNRKTSCLKCFYQTEITDEFLDCESEGILGSVAGIVGNIQANEVLKKILKLDNSLDNSILIINLLTLSFRKIKFLKKKNCTCKKK